MSIEVGLTLGRVVRTLIIWQYATRFAISQGAFESVRIFHFRGDFVAAATLLKDIATHELAFRIWLESTIAHPDIFGHINQEIAIPLSHLPNARCRERALGLLHLWRTVDGYREVCKEARGLG